MKKDKSIAEANRFLQKNGNSTAAEINKNLRSKKLPELNPTELVNAFPKIPVQNRRYKYVYQAKPAAPAQGAKKPAPAKQPAKKAAKPATAKKPVKKAAPGKKVCDKKTCTKKPAKKAAPAKKTCDKKECAKKPWKYGCKRSDFVAAVMERLSCHGPFKKIKLDDGRVASINIRQYNAVATLANCLSEMPEAEKNPEAFVFLAGRGEYPSTFRGIEVFNNGRTAGVILIPRCDLCSAP